MGKIGKNEFPLPTEFCKNNDSIVQLMLAIMLYLMCIYCVISHVDFKKEIGNTKI